MQRQSDEGWIDIPMSEDRGFRDAQYAQAIAKGIITPSQGREIRIVHVCGTHEDTISRYSAWLQMP